MLPKIELLKPTGGLGSVSVTSHPGQSTVGTGGLLHGFHHVSTVAQKEQIMQWL